MIAGADIGLDDAAGGPRRECTRRQHVIESPTDVAGPEIPPRRPPGKQVGIVGIELPTHVHELRAEQRFEQGALLGPLAHRIWLALLGMHIHLRARDVQVAAENQRAPFGLESRGPIDEAGDERQLRGVVLAAVGAVDRGDHQVAVLDLDDAGFPVEGRVTEHRIDGEEVLADVERHTGIPLERMPVGVVVRHAALGRDLRGGRFQLLQADDVRAIALQPLAHLCRASPDPVHVPGRDFHARMIIPLTAGGPSVYYQQVMKPSGYNLTATFAALADPTRRAILARLATGEATVNELAAPFDMSQPAISKHLKVLERAGLVSRGREAQRRPRKLEPRPLAEATDWIERYRRIWEANYKRLDALLQELKLKQKKTVDGLLEDVRPKPRKRKLK